MAGVQISKAKLSHMADRFESMKKRFEGVKKKAEHTMGKVLATGETVGTAFLMGLTNGKTGGVEVLGMPLELLLGAGFSLGGYLGLAGKHSDHLNHIGDGALASYATVLGVQMGMTWKETGKLGAPKRSALAASKGTRLTEEEMEAAIRAAA